MTSVSKYALLNCSVAICATVYPLDAVAQSPTAPAVAAVCAPCHGLDGIGRDVEIPNIAGQHSIYLREQLLAFKRGRRKHPEMYFVGRHLNDQEIDELVLYFSTLPPR